MKVFLPSKSYRIEEFFSTSHEILSVDSLRFQGPGSGMRVWEYLLGIIVSSEKNGLESEIEKFFNLKISVVDSTRCRTYEWSLGTFCLSIWMLKFESSKDEWMKQYDSMLRANTTDTPNFIFPDQIVSKHGSKNIKLCMSVVFSSIIRKMK